MKVQKPLGSAVGFTLLEILLALTIFAIVGLVSSQLLSQTVDSQATLSASGQRLQDIHRAMQVLQRDFMQLTNRPIRDEFGALQAPLLIGTDGMVEFTRAGWRNPLGLPRAEVQRVAYRWDDEKLLRAYWIVLDRAQDSEPTHQTLLEGVSQIEFYALDESGNEYPFWPNPGLSGPGLNLVGVLVRLDVEPFGVIERIWEVPSV